MSGTQAAHQLVLERWYGGRIGVDTEETGPFEAKSGGSLSRFIEKESLEKSVPMVIRQFGRSFPDGCPDWAEIRAMCGRNQEATVAVSRGVEEHDGPTTKVRVPVPLADFVDGILAGNPEAAVVQAQSSSGDDEMTSQAGGCSSEPQVDGSSQKPRGDGVLYAKQFDIVSLLPELKARLPSWSEPLALAPATTGLGGDRIKEVSCKGLFSPWRCLHTVCGWIAPAGAVTGAHTDDEHNVLVVLAGEKAVTLVPPADARLCYPNSKYDSGTVCFDANIESPDLGAHPSVARARRQTVLLRAGDALVLPQGWVHQVRSPVASASLNVFASTVGEAVTHGAGRMLAEWMHGIGVYRWGHCVCHAAPDCKECGWEDDECGREVKDRARVARGSLLALAGAAVGVGLAGAFASRMAAVGSGCLGLR